LTKLTIIDVILSGGWAMIAIFIHMIIGIIFHIPAIFAPTIVLWLIPEVIIGMYWMKRKKLKVKA